MKAFFYSLGTIICVLLSGCRTAEILAESAKDKNIAYGRDTWGGDIILEMTGSDNPFPNINIWAGRSRTWYISLKKDSDVKEISEIIEKSNSSLEVKAGASGVSVLQSSYTDKPQAAAPSADSGADSAAGK